MQKSDEYRVFYRSEGRIRSAILKLFALASCG